MSNKKGNRIFIIGAGFAGENIAHEISKKSHTGEVVAFLDDDPAKIGTKIGKIPVLGPIREFAGILRTTPADEAIIAIPTADKKELSVIYRILSRAEFNRIRILPNISQIVNGHAHLVQARDINPEDLLTRNPVLIDLVESLSYLRGKRVLITGAGGSIGSELARQLLSGGAERLYLLGHGENSIYKIDRELRLLQEGGVGEKATVVPVIGDLQDSQFMNFILKRLKADVIFHCAAHKHVPMLEYNPVEAVKNNVFGTYNLIKAAEASGTEKLVLISTDKAVNPSCVYGVTKKIAEMLVLQEREKGQDFMVVRFGNVLGSRGSIIPLFKEQILAGGPVTVTHPETTRYFMTIPEASSLVLKAGGVGENRGLYVLDMGEPLKILELARQMIHFYGFTEDDIPINFIGMRPGEKVKERLWSEGEKPSKTDYARIFKVAADSVNLSAETVLNALRPVCYFDESRSELYRNRKQLRGILKDFFPGIRVPDDEPEY
ncbi:polysaccharide biosynthesis protein [Oceanispirochaeta crateris]|uniref:Polysaccharide biosynthesis protein n=1 Tax=Oceanispirochaeta crateris TaxID=2518645 RepID=A0A5C1QP42_9SPIO|nr:nucleoside-diphosphate sugar epimerase/dehydratase [Oceanispirochaeta crateris]QEN07952.1 polysaccharide biosynthesis protein [Oceanispirochaeta crateris]